MQVWGGSLERGKAWRAVGLKADPIAEKLCREFLLKIQFRRSEPFPKTRSGTRGERKLVVELVRGWQRRGAKKGFAGVDVGARGDVNDFPGLFTGGGMQSEETVREIHRDDYRTG